MIPVLFEDEFFIVAYKESGLPTQATLDKSRPHFYGLLYEQLRQQRGSAFYLGLHHRLDRGTSGLIILSKSKDANEPLSRLFKEHRIQKTYLCLTQFKANCPRHWTIQNFLADFQDGKSKKTKMKSVLAGGKPARTEFRLLESFKRALLLEACPQTGRMHQIRVHLHEQQMGIWGDDLYKSPQSYLAPRLMLHACQLEFTHPFTHKPLKIEAEAPPDMVGFIQKMRA